ncbi:MAG: trypsin-like peptidase domain-containing protein [Planctomycetaceae bacterium]|nr:trypsin-like peptidase domain-containing protein [Planctomycetaceae bacterium]
MRYFSFSTVLLLFLTFFVPFAEADIVQELNEVLRNTVKKTAASIVHIESKRHKSNKELSETGCGIIVEIENNEQEKQKFILTCGHIADKIQLDRLTILTKERFILKPLSAKVNNDFDLAVIEFSSPSEAVLQPAVLGDSSKIETGEFILTVGSPFGLERSVSHGIISAVQRREIPSAPDQAVLAGFFQIDAAVNPGNSGGPVFNLRGETIGIVTAIATQSGGSEGVAFVTPINTMMRIAEQLVQNNGAVRPFIGVGLEPNFTVAEHQRLGLNRLVGAKIARVQPDSPAAQAGLQPEDVILHLGDIEIEDDLHFISAAAQLEIGKIIEMTILRNGKSFVVPITPSSQVSK